MIEGQSVGVVIPCQEAHLAVSLLIQDLPAFIDQVVVVDDGGQGRSAVHLRRAHDPKKRAGARLVILHHEKKRGLGAAVVTGYRALMVAGVDLCVVAWPGDALDPGEIEALLGPLLLRRADLVGGSRLGPGAPRLARVRGLLAARVFGWALGSRPLPDLGCSHHAVTGVALRRLPLRALSPGEAFSLDLVARARSEGLITEAAPLRPLTRRRHHLPAQGLWVLGRATLRRLRLRRPPRVLPSNARARARVAAARPVPAAPARLPEPTR